MKFSRSGPEVKSAKLKELDLAKRLEVRSQVQELAGVLGIRHERDFLYLSDVEGVKDDLFLSGERVLFEEAVLYEVLEGDHEEGEENDCEKELDCLFGAEEPEQGHRDRIELLPELLLKLDDRSFGDEDRKQPDEELLEVGRVRNRRELHPQILRNDEVVSAVKVLISLRLRIWRGGRSGG